MSLQIAEHSGHFCDWNGLQEIRFHLLLNEKSAHHGHLVMFGLMVLEEVSRTASGGLVSTACEGSRIARRDLPMLYLPICRRCKQHKAKLQ